MRDYTYYQVVETGKIGCTTNLEGRKDFKLLSKSSYNDQGLHLEEIETREFNNDHTASIYEQILQINMGARVDNVSYEQTKINLAKARRSYLENRTLEEKEETSKKLSAASKKAWKEMTVETKEARSAKLSAAKTGENHPQYGTRGEAHFNYGSKRTDEARQKMRDKATGRSWWNNGINENLARVSPGEGFILGRMSPNLGNTSGYNHLPFLFETQSKGGKASGKLMANKLWWNNGIINKRALTCPEGFVPGVLRKKKEI